RVGGRREVVYDGVRLEELLTTCDWPIEEDPTKDYDELLRGLKACGSGDFEQDSEMRTATVSLGSFRSTTFSRQHEERTPAVDVGVTQRYDSCGDRPHAHQPKEVLTGRLSGTILQQWFRSPHPSSKSAIQPKARKEDRLPCWRKERSRI
ncbi:unnamed protein product, partial [Strongylus vulgaris]